jgi:hypothetical protein
MLTCVEDYGQTLNEAEKTLAKGVPDVALALLENVPRLDPVIQILAANRHSPGAGGGAGYNVSLRAVSAFFYSAETSGLVTPRSVDARAARPRER